MSTTLTKEEARHYGAKGSKTYADNLTWCIEGEMLTTVQMAERLGEKPDTVRRRLRKAQKKDGPVTWADLKPKGAK